MFLNNKKISIIHILFYENHFITDFKEKARLFNKRLSTVTFSTKDIGKIIQNRDSDKAPGHDNVSIRMLKI